MYWLSYSPGLSCLVSSSVLVYLHSFHRTARHIVDCFPVSHSFLLLIWSAALASSLVTSCTHERGASSVSHPFPMETTGNPGAKRKREWKGQEVNSKLYDRGNNRAFVCTAKRRLRGEQHTVDKCRKNDHCRTRALEIERGSNEESNREIWRDESPPQVLKSVWSLRERSEVCVCLRERGGSIRGSLK